jgi:tetratricopeptide (TPR) repeat protein
MAIDMDEWWTQILAADPAEDLMGQIRDPITGRWKIPFPENFAWHSRESAPVGASLDRLYARGGLRTDLPLYYCAVFDSGLIHDHPAIRPRISASDEWDGTGEGTEDENGHGTIVAMRTFIPIDPSFEVRLINVKVVDRRGIGSPDVLVAGMRWLAKYAGQHPDHVIAANMSVGAYQRTRLGLISCQGTCPVCTAAVELADLGIKIYAAAGNRRGATSCPGSAAVHHKSPAIDAVGASDYSGSGIGTSSEPSRIVMEPLLDPATGPGEVPPQPTPANEYAHGKRYAAAGAYCQAASAFAYVLDHAEYALNAIAGLRLGILLSNIADRARVNEGLRRVLAMGDDEFAVLSYMANRARAVEAYRKVMAIGDDVLAPLAAVQAGFLLFGEGDIAEARECFAAGGSWSWRISAISAYHLGIAILETEKEKGAPAAWRAFAKTVELGEIDNRFGGDGEFLVITGLSSLAKLLIPFGQYEQAEQYLERAVAADGIGRFPEVRYNLAVVSVGLGNLERAAELYAELVRMSPPTAFSEAAERGSKALEKHQLSAEHHPSYLKFRISEMDVGSLIVKILNSVESAADLDATSPMF